MSNGNKRAHELDTSIVLWDDSMFFPVDNALFPEAKKYQLSVLRNHLRVGDQQYTEQNYVTNDQTLTESINALDIALALSTSTVLSKKINLSEAEVSTLGTAPVTLLPAPAATESLQLIDIKWAIYPASSLDVGNQNLEVYFDGLANYLAMIRGDTVESPTTLGKGVQIQSEHEFLFNSPIKCKLQNGVDPISGQASMAFWLVYSLIE